MLKKSIRVIEYVENASPPKKKRFAEKLVGRSSRFNGGLAVAVCAVLVVVGIVAVKSFAASGSATLSLSPSSSYVTNGQTFTVQIIENSGTAPTNAVEANITYPAASLQLQSISATGSGFPLVAQSTGANGSIIIAQATNGGSPAVTGSQLVATLTFTSLMTSGSASVTFATGSAVVSSLDNTALLLTTTGGTYMPDTTAPSVPTGLNVTGTTGSTISLAWTASTDNVGVTGYNIYRDGSKVGSSTATSFTDTGLVQGATHSYQVTAFDAAGNESAKSTAVNGTVPDTTPPIVPTGLAAQATAYNAVKLTWNATTDTGGSGLAGYRIYRNGSSTMLASVAAGTLTYTDSTVSGSTTYTYTVSAYDGAGNESAQSSSVSVTTPAPPDTTPPSTPTGLQSTAVNLQSITLSWTASTDNVAVAGYQVYRNGVLVGSPTATTYTDTGLSTGTAYQYTVKAIDTSGNLSAAAALSVTTLPLKVGDLNYDNQVNALDLSVFLSDWAQTGTNLPADFNHDGIVNIYDLSMLLSDWGK